mmetsp:Transcript_22625/g.27311  ORF Transcript_22625/g.27311 Transcript_22625/m.27311 type:complete len:351 (-) Transcript_22625:480-1532(-)
MVEPAEPLPEDMKQALLAAAALWGLYLVFSQTGRQQIRCIFYKQSLGLSAVNHILFSRDRKWKKTDLPKPDLILDQEGRKKKIVFIRHGESDWNEIFNRGFGPGFPVRLVIGIIREFFMWPTADSVFVDSPLSKLGFRQARSLLAFLEEPPTIDDPKVKELVEVINGKKGSSLLVCSNLRRAIATGCVCLWGRLKRTGEKLKILSSPQEISRNPDTLALALPGGIPDLTQSLGKEIQKELKSEYVPEALFDASLNTGSKKASGNGLTRIKAFAEWSMTCKEDTIIVTGHSLWFKQFFATYLPSSSDHNAKKKKMSNCGVVAFELIEGRDPSVHAFRIDPQSITVVYGKIG